ncbi:protein of unknown function [Methylocaldum szegediense]|uniref:SRCR domain-containing protein n=1 Tax=Methylocaldum szegediense TaxID=73780 RepID=A0ABM9HXQ7_9GAMM|nr:protein of unknown function [Methylocaldum szegediense]
MRSPCRQHETCVTLRAELSEIGCHLSVYKCESRPGISVVWSVRACLGQHTGWEARRCGYYKDNHYELRIFTD